MEAEAPTCEHRPAAARVIPWLGLLAAGLALRLISINSRGLWFDEAWRVWAARLPSVADVLHVAWAQPPSAPLYWIGLHAWIGLLGHGDVAVRAFSVIPSVCNIVAIYFLGRLLCGIRAGWIAAVLLTLSPMAVEAGQEATMYSWTMLAATLTLGAGWKWLRDGRGAISYVACAWTLTHLHYLGVLVIACLFVAGLAARRSGTSFTVQSLPHLGSWAGIHAGLAVLWLPWGFAMFLRIGERWQELRQLRHGSPLKDLYHAAGHLIFSASPQTFWPRLPVLITIILGAAAVSWALWRVRREPRVLLFAGVGAAALGTLLGVSAATGFMLYQPRFLTLFLPVLLCVLACGLSVSLPERPRITAGWIVLGGWMVIQLAGLEAFYAHPVHGRDGMREIGDLLTSEVRAGDVVICNYPMLLWSVAQYYGGTLHGLPSDWDVRWGYPLLPPSEPSWTRSQLDALPRVAGSAQRVWLLYLPVVDPGGILLATLRAEYRLSAIHTYPLLTVYLFDGQLR